jgi:hypothetical protein
MKIFEKQGYHLLCLGFLLLGVYLVARDDFLQGSFLGVSAKTWFWLSIFLPVIHQVYVVIFWRAELHYQRLTAWFGERAFTYWTVGFMVLILSRPILMIGLAITNRGTFPIPAWLGYALAFLCLLSSLYVGFSVLRYFGIERALGMDHFQPEIYREKPFVKEGIFKWSSNAMYLYGFLLLWVPGFLLLSKAGLLSALFSHLYIWVHFYFTEFPDMGHIYRAK